MNRILTLLLFFSFSLNAQQEFTETMVTADGARSYIVQLPSSHNENTKMPLILVLHGLGDNAQNMTNTGFGILGEAENFIAVYPQGLPAPFAGNAWNNGTTISVTGFNPDDIGFLRQLIDHMILTYNVDHTRVYSCGFSMGGIMSHRIACELSDKVAAIASQAGTIATNIDAGCTPERAVPILHMHGDADETVNYNGDPGFGLNSVAQTMENWREINGCSETPVDTPVPDSNADNLTITKTEYPDCDNDTEVILYTIHGGTHIWLGTNNDLSSTIEFWDFFQRHSNDLASPVNELDNDILFTVSPNPAHELIRINGINENFRVTILDMVGKELNNFSNTNEIPINDLQNGSYLLRITMENTGKSSIRKFIKM